MKHDLYENGGKKISGAVFDLAIRMKREQDKVFFGLIFTQSLLKFRILWKIVQMAYLKMGRSEIIVELDINGAKVLLLFKGDK